MFGIDCWAVNENCENVQIFEVKQRNILFRRKSFKVTDILTRMKRLFISKAEQCKREAKGQ